MASNLYEKLHDLENFDPNAFIGDEKTSQPLCDFMLATTLFYNDLKDAISAHSLLRESMPKGKHERTKEWGAFSGMEIHLIRQTMSLVHEFLEVIKNNEGIFKDDFYNKTYMQMSKKSRKCWEVVLGVALNKQDGSGDLARLLHRIRNHASFHFEPRALQKGYKEFFFHAGKVKQKAVISRGNSMESSRFYFADAAAQQCVEREFQQGSREAMKQFVFFLENINQSIFELVDRFIFRRNYAYSKGAG